MKVKLMMSILLSGAVLLAEESGPQEAKAGKRQEDLSKLAPSELLSRRMAARERRFERGGGRVMRPNTQKGEVVYVNCQKRAKQEWIEESVNYFIFETKLNIIIKDGTFEFPNPKIQGDMTLFVVDDEMLPPVLVAPESRWATVNIAPLAKGRGAALPFFEARVKKELSRGFALLCGGAESQFPGALTSGISNSDGLDVHIDYQLPVDVLSRFSTYLRPFGVSPAEYTTYRYACEEGWAAAPTNDSQRAIHEKIAREKETTLKGPAKPRTIKFDPAKGE